MKSIKENKLLGNRKTADEDRGETYNRVNKH